jgi:hypothetical protein
MKRQDNTMRFLKTPGMVFYGQGQKIVTFNSRPGSFFENDSCLLAWPFFKRFLLPAPPSGPCLSSGTNFSWDLMVEELS